MKVLPSESYTTLNATGANCWTVIDHLCSYFDKVCKLTWQSIGICVAGGLLLVVVAVPLRFLLYIFWR